MLLSIWDHRQHPVVPQSIWDHRQHLAVPLSIWGRHLTVAFTAGSLKNGFDKSFDMIPCGRGL